MACHAFIDLGKRYSPCAIAAAHDGKHVVKNNHGRRDAKEKASYNAQTSGADKTAEDGGKIPGKRFDEQFLFQG